MIMNYDVDTNTKGRWDRDLIPANSVPGNLKTRCEPRIPLATIRQKVMARHVVPAQAVEQIVLSVLIDIPRAIEINELARLVLDHHNIVLASSERSLWHKLDQFLFTKLFEHHGLWYVELAQAYRMDLLLERASPVKVDEIRAIYRRTFGRTLQCPGNILHYIERLGHSIIFKDGCFLACYGSNETESSDSAYETQNTDDSTTDDSVSDATFSDASTSFTSWSQRPENPKYVEKSSSSSLSDETDSGSAIVRRYLSSMGAPMRPMQTNGRRRQYRAASEPVRPSTRAASVMSDLESTMTESSTESDTSRASVRSICDPNFIRKCIFETMKEKGEVKLSVLNTIISGMCPYQQWKHFGVKTFREFVKYFIIGDVISIDANDVIKYNLPHGNAKQKSDDDSDCSDESSSTTIADDNVNKVSQAEPKITESSADEAPPASGQSSVVELIAAITDIINEQNYVEYPDELEQKVKEKGKTLFNPNFNLKKQQDRLLIDIMTKIPVEVSTAGNGSIILKSSLSCNASDSGRSYYALEDLNVLKDTVSVDDVDQSELRDALRQGDDTVNDVRYCVDNHL